MVPERSRSTAHAFEKMATSGTAERAACLTQPSNEERTTVEGTAMEETVREGCAQEHDIDISREANLQTIIRYVGTL